MSKNLSIAFVNMELIKRQLRKRSLKQDKSGKSNNGIVGRKERVRSFNLTDSRSAPDLISLIIQG